MTYTWTLKKIDLLTLLAYQNEMVKSGSNDVRISIELAKPTIENVQVYCVLIHDRLVEYSYKPLNGLVQRIV